MGPMERWAYEQQARDSGAEDEGHQWERDDQVTQDLLDLVGRLAPLHIIGAWTDAQCREAEQWSAAQHFKASDNPVLVPPMPPHVAALAASEPQA